MAKTTTREAPFDHNGNLMHYPQPIYYRAGVAHGPDWREVEPFQARMRVDEGVTSGRSAKYVHLLDEDGHRYPMFITDLVTLLRTRTIVRGVVHVGDDDRWYVAKRGSNYAVALV